MSKNKLIAIVIATLSFFLFFEGTFNPAGKSTIWVIISVIGMLGGTITALFIANNETKDQGH